MIYQFLDYLPLHAAPSFVQTAALSALACAVAFLLSILSGPKLIACLAALKAGQPIRLASEVHKLAELHGRKLGTPTMGGILIIGPALLATFLFVHPTNPYILVCSGVTLALAVLGLADDLLKVRKHTSEGLAGRVKLLVQAAVSLLALSFLYFDDNQAAAAGLSDTGAMARMPVGELVSNIYVPFYGVVDVGWLIIPFGALVIVGTSNSVNLTDGLDGLAAGCTIACAIAYGALALAAGDALFSSSEYLQLPHHRNMSELAVFCMTLVGACLGFLWYNCHPARLFMGDTGSLALGGALGAVAVCTCQEILLVIIGGVFVVESCSVILQVGWFKYTRIFHGEGRRIFRMTPIHHHFELGGLKETQVIVRFWIAALILAVLGLSFLAVQ